MVWSYLYIMCSYVGVFINAESLHSCVPCGSYLHCILAATSAPKARVFLHSISQKPSYCFPCIGRCIPEHIILCEKLQNNANATMLNPLQASILFCSFHSVTHLPHNTNPIIPLKKPNRLAVASSISMHSVSGGRYFHPLPIPTLHCIFILSATSARKARVLRTLALWCKSQAFYKISHPFLILKNWTTHIYPKNKKESKGKWLAIGLQG